MEPHIIHVTAQNQLTATVEAAVEKKVEAALRRVLDARNGDQPGGRGWLTNAQAQDFLGLSKTTLARYRADGTLTYSKLGSSVYYRLSDIEALLDRCAVSASGDSSGSAEVPTLAAP